MPHTRKLEPDIRCPLEYGLEVFGGKWKSRILCVLSKKQTLRYGQLRGGDDEHLRCRAVVVPEGASA